jgi:hypothetical protein
MFIAMNRFRVKKGSRTHLRKYGWDASRISIVFRVSWSFICSGVRRRKTIRSIPRIPCGKASRPSRRGLDRKNFGPRMRAPVTRQLDRSIWSIRNLKASKYVRPLLERRRARELSPPLNEVANRSMPIRWSNMVQFAAPHMSAFRGKADMVVCVLRVGR